MTTPRRQPKKSEKIEVRVSHEEKRALQTLAQRQGRTISTIVRGLVADHLKETLRAEQQSSIPERTAMILKPVKTHPRKLAAALAACVGLGLTLMPTAAAEPLTVAFSGKIGADGARAFNSVLKTEPGVPQLIEINDPDSDAGDYRIELTVTPDDTGNLLLEVNLYHGLEGGEPFARRR